MCVRLHFSEHYLSYRFASASESLLAYFIYMCVCMHVCDIRCCAASWCWYAILPALLCCHLREKQSAISLNVYAFAIRILFVYLLFGGCVLAGVLGCGMERIMFMG